MSDIKSKHIEMVDVESIVPNPKNANRHSIEQIKIKDTNYIIFSDGRLYNYKTKKFKKATPTRDGYLTYGIFKNGKNKTTQAHRLVAKHFLKDYSEHLVVNHIDFNRKNNNVQNLQMCTVKQNVNHSSKVGRYTRYGEKNNNCKYHDCVVLMLKTYLNSGLSCAEISRKTGIKRRYINGVKLGTR